MGPTTYALCQKPVIGILLWIANMCVSSTLIDGLPISFATVQTVSSKPFKVRVDEVYGFGMQFEFDSVEKRIADKLTGTGFDKTCRSSELISENSAELQEVHGVVIPLKIVIRKIGSNVIVTDEIFNSRCTFGSSEKTKYRGVRGVRLERGEYIAEITNLQTVADFDEIKTSISLTGPYVPGFR